MITRARDPEAVKQFDSAVNALLARSALLFDNARREIGPPSLNFPDGMPGAALYACLTCMVCAANKNGMSGAMCDRILHEVHEKLYPKAEVKT